MCTYLVYYLRATLLVSEKQAYCKISSLGWVLGLLCWIIWRQSGVGLYSGLEHMSYSETLFHKRASLKQVKEEACWEGKKILTSLLLQNCLNFSYFFLNYSNAFTLVLAVWTWFCIFSLLVSTTPNTILPVVLLFPHSLCWTQTFWVKLIHLWCFACILRFSWVCERIHV